MTTRSGNPSRHRNSQCNRQHPCVQRTAFIVIATALIFCSVAMIMILLMKSSRVSKPVDHAQSTIGFSNYFTAKYGEVDRHAQQRVDEANSHQVQSYGKSERHEIDTPATPVRPDFAQRYPNTHSKQSPQPVPRKARNPARNSMKSGKGDRGIPSQISESSHAHDHFGHHHHHSHSDPDGTSGLDLDGHVGHTHDGPCHAGETGRVSSMTLFGCVCASLTKSLSSRSSCGKVPTLED